MAVFTSSYYAIVKNTFRENIINYSSQDDEGQQRNIIRML